MVAVFFDIHSIIQSWKTWKMDIDGPCKSWKMHIKILESHGKPLSCSVHALSVVLVTRSCSCSVTFLLKTTWSCVKYFDWLNDAVHECVYQTDEDPPHGYSQLFYLKNMNGAYCIGHDIFRLLIHNAWWFNISCLTHIFVRFLRRRTII